jgi:glycosyltransferase involved in cell wall biosynthesis
MPKKPPVILLSNIRWDFLWQWTQILATMFAEAGYPTVCVETTGITNPRPDPATVRKVVRRLRRIGRPEGRKSELPPNLLVYSPLVVPPTNSILRRLNKRFFVPKVVRDLRKLVKTEPVFIAFPPTQTTLDILSDFPSRMIWYHCVLNYEEYPRTPADIRDTEQRLLERADLVTVDSSFLKEKHRYARPDLVQIESGVDFELFHRAYVSSPNDRVSTVCFFGSMDERRFDFELVRELAESGFTVRLIGTLADPALARVPGIDYRGQLPHTELPGHLRDVDALIIPYKVTPFSKGTFPAKTYECLATGKPVVATPLPDLLRFDEQIYLAGTPREFVRVLRELPGRETPEKVEARIALARWNSWKARFEEFERLLEQHV